LVLVWGRLSGCPFCLKYATLSKETPINVSQINHFAENNGQYAEKKSEYPDKFTET
jgi:hypothetical protein